MQQDDYQFEEKIGQGGFAEVWRATRKSDKQQVAIKRVRVSANPLISERLVRESQWIQQLEHPNVVRSFGVWHKTGETCLVMELCLGSVSDWVRRRGPLSVLTAVKVTIQALRGLSIAHTKGIVHRDVKPENLLIASDGTIKVADFGISTLFEDQASFSRTGGVMGTVPFMAPEQRQGQPTSPQTDLYSLAASLVWMCTAELPGDLYVPGVLARLSLRLPPKLCDVIAKAGAYELAERYASSQQFLDSLETLVPMLPGEELDLASLPVVRVAADTFQPHASSVEGQTTQRGALSRWSAITPIAAVLAFVAAAMGALLQWQQRQELPQPSATTTTSKSVLSPSVRKLGEVPLCEDAPSFFNSTRALGPRETMGVVAEDLDGDGFEELLFTNQYDENLSIYNIHRDGLRKPALLPISRSDSSVAIGDLNKDGKNDLVTAHPDLASFEVRYGEGGYKFSTPTVRTQDNMPRNPHLVDWDQDGRLDVLLVRGLPGMKDPNAGCVAFIKNLGDGRFQGHLCVGYSSPLFTLSRDREVYSVEENELLRRKPDPNTLLLGEAESVFSKDYFIDGILNTVWLKDLDRDGRDEVYLKVTGVGSALLRLDTKQPSKPCAMVRNTSYLEDLATIGDFNKDGLLDFVSLKTCAFCESNHYLSLGQRK